MLRVGEFGLARVDAEKIGVEKINALNDAARADILRIAADRKSEPRVRAPRNG